MQYRIAGNFMGSKFVLCYLQLICVFNFRSVHFTLENTPIITYICVLNFHSDRLRTKMTKFEPHEYSYGIPPELMRHKDVSLSIVDW